MALLSASSCVATGLPTLSRTPVALSVSSASATNSTHASAQPRKTQHLHGTPISRPTQNRLGHPSPLGRGCSSASRVPHSGCGEPMAVGHSHRTLVTCSDSQGKGFAKRPPLPPPKKPAPVPPTPLLSSEPAQSVKKLPEEDDDDVDDVIPEVVTNRILRRIGVTVGAPLLLGLGFFPLFYYLKVVQKVDVPEWLPLLSSTTLFGLAGLGISYGVISTSWDPQREGTLLGWKEAKANWPAFMQTMSQKKR